MITLNNVSIGYGAEDVVKNFSLTIQQNISIIGPNGCGKTTLLKAMAGLLPHRGEMDIQGSVAMLSQLPPVYFSFPVYDTVMMGRYRHIRHRKGHGPNQADHHMAQHALDMVGLEGLKNKTIGQLSGGQLQRVFLARTLAQDPDIILLDEPTNHLDLTCQVDIINHLKTWSVENNRLVVGVLHDINLALQLSDQLAVMCQGQLVAHGNGGEITQSRVLDPVYGMDVAGYMRESLARWK